MANILNATEDYNPKNGLKNIFTKLIEIIKAINANTNAIAAMGNPKVYKALLTQTGTSAPVATVLVNTLSGTPVWSYNSVGQYILTLTGEFIATKTLVFIGGGDTASGDFFEWAIDTTTKPNSLTFVFRDVSSNSPSNNLLSETAITIEVYP